MKNFKLMAAGVGLVFGASGAASGQASLMGLGDLPGGDFHSSAYAVSADGRVVVGHGTASGNVARAFRWTAETGMVSLGPLSGSQHVYAQAVSADGSVIAGYGKTGITTDFRAFRWTNEAGMILLGDLPGGSVSSVANGVSGDGSTIVGSSSGDGGSGFRWTESEGMTALPGASGITPNSAYGISGDGLTSVGTCFTGAYRPAARWTEQGIEALRRPGGLQIDAQARGVSHDGSVIAGQLTFNRVPFRWTQATGVVSLGELPLLSGGSSTALAVSGSGVVIVGYSRMHAFYWTEQGGLQDLNFLLASYGVDMTGWELREASGVSFDGRVVVGRGTRNGTTEAYIAHLPLPGSVGACCHGTTCAIATESECIAAGGVYRGGGTLCATNNFENPVSCCGANFDGRNGVDTPDVFVFLRAWFSDDPRADFDGNGVRDVPDIFAFVAAWYAGC